MDVLELVGQPAEKAADAQALAVAYARLYDERGGAIEIEIKESKQGLGITKRRKKGYAGQQIVMLLGTLAHNVVVWAKKWLSSEVPKLKRYGVQRMVRDVMAVSGFVELGKAGAIKRVVLNGASPLARATAKALRALLKSEQVRVILGET